MYLATASTNGQWVLGWNAETANKPMGPWAEYRMYLQCSSDGPIGWKAPLNPPIHLFFTQCHNQSITKRKMGPWAICQTPDIGPWFPHHLQQLSKGFLNPSVTSIQAAICGGKGPNNIWAVHTKVAEPTHDIHTSKGFLNPSVNYIQATMCGGKGPNNIWAVHTKVAEPTYDIHAGLPV
ncbi:hypothetical protein BDN67DRAFT_983198 [Paxillus ammoniavirescens]|nr:hypothetical protein BDN67DRAFT_983198 [Paxillus ammoniavirescens]